MFGNLFGKKKDMRQEDSRDIDMTDNAMRQALSDMKKEDLLAGLKIGASQLQSQVFSFVKTDRGVHIESAFSLLGSVAGYACQENVFAKGGKIAIITGADGHKYFSGDDLNRPLAENTDSIWSFTKHGAQLAGKIEVLDVEEIFAYVASTIGSPEFGVPRIPDGHQPSELPAAYVKSAWPAVKACLEKWCDSPDQWPVMIGMTIRNTILEAQDSIDPAMAVRIAMESAIPASKMNLNHRNI